jgi:hypothetical protein
MPGMAELMDGAMQQAPQPGRQFMGESLVIKKECGGPLSRA